LRRLAQRHESAQNLHRRSGSLRTARPREPERQSVHDLARFLDWRVSSIELGLCDVQQAIQFGIDGG
jgi:hypothetical protein